MHFHYQHKSNKGQHTTDGKTLLPNRSSLMQTTTIRTNRATSAIHGSHKDACTVRLEREAKRRSKTVKLQHRAQDDSRNRQPTAERTPVIQQSTSIEQPLITQYCYTHAASLKILPYYPHTDIHTYTISTSTHSESRAKAQQMTQHAAFSFSVICCGAIGCGSAAVSNGCIVVR